MIIDLPCTEKCLRSRNHLPHVLQEHAWLLIHNFQQNTYDYIAPSLYMQCSHCYDYKENSKYFKLIILLLGKEIMKQSASVLFLRSIFLNLGAFSALKRGRLIFLLWTELEAPNKILHLWLKDNVLIILTAFQYKTTSYKYKIVMLTVRILKENII